MKKPSLKEVYLNEQEEKPIKADEALDMILDGFKSYEEVSLPQIMAFIRAVKAGEPEARKFYELTKEDGGIDYRYDSEEKRFISDFEKKWNPDSL